MNETILMTGTPFVSSFPHEPEMNGFPVPKDKWLTMDMKTVPLPELPAGVNISHPTPLWSPIVVDLSHHDTVDADSGFHDMKAFGIGAVIHKASQGMATIDNRYATMRKRIKSAGLLLGSYHFATNGPGADQADHYFKSATPEKGDLLCLDWEENGGAYMMRREAENFVLHICALTGNYPLLYTGDSFIRDQMAGVVSSPLYHCKLWLASYPYLKPHPPTGWNTVTLHQFTETARIPGVEDNCDLNNYHGTVDQLVQKWPLL